MAPKTDKISIFMGNVECTKNLEKSMVFIGFSMMTGSASAARNVVFRLFKRGESEGGSCGIALDRRLADDGKRF